MDELRSSIEKQYSEQLEKACDHWKKEEMTRIQNEAMKEKEQLLKVVRSFHLFFCTSCKVMCTGNCLYTNYLMLQKPHSVV